MLAFEASWAMALGTSGTVPMADAMTAAGVIRAAQMVPDILGAGANSDGMAVPALVALLRQGLPDGVARAVHTGATSQDVMDTALALVLRDVSDRLEVRLVEVLAALTTLHTRFGAQQMMGRTRMQAALPIPVAARLAAWRTPLASHAAALPALRAWVEVVQIGGAVGLADAPPGVAQSVARDLGLGCVPHWQTDRSRILDYGHWLVLVAGSLGKMGQDIALMAQQGVDEVALNGAGGSSAMPHKQNPVLAEMLVALARFTAGQQGVLAQAMVHEQERSGAAWALEWLVLPAMCEATGAALRHAATLAGQISRLGPAQ